MITPKIWNGKSRRHRCLFSYNSKQGNSIKTNKYDICSIKESIILYLGHCKMTYKKKLSFPAQIKIVEITFNS